MKLIDLSRSLWYKLSHELLIAGPSDGRYACITDYCTLSSFQGSRHQVIESYLFVFLHHSAQPCHYIHIHMNAHWASGVTNEACWRRYEKVANQLLAESTVAGQDVSVQYLAACAALQQWEQSALAFLLLHDSPRPLSADQLSAAVESLLEDNFSVSTSKIHPCWTDRSAKQHQGCLSVIVFQTQPMSNLNGQLQLEFR